MEIRHEHIDFLKKLMEQAEKESRSVDPDDKLAVKHINLPFVVLKQGNVHCPAGCFKLPGGNCFCFKPWE